MTMDWDNIKYVFQLPLRWYRWMDNKIRHMYGADFIRVKHDGYNDGLEVGVDYDSFANEVRKIAGQPEDGWVRSVDNNYPDAFGDVKTNSIKGIDSGSQTYYPDEMGIVSVPFSSTVQTVDNVGPDTGGNIQLNAVRSVNGEYYPDDNGNIYLPFSGTVKSVDGIGPDSGGNVWLGALTTLDMADHGSIAGPSYEGDKPVAPMSHNHMMDELSGARDADGNLTYIKTINTTIKPDGNGNVNINIPDTPPGTYLVASVDGIRPTDVSGNVQLNAVRSIKLGDDQILRPDSNGQIELDDIDGKVKTVNDIEPDDDGNVDLGDLVYTVNGEGPDAAGNITINTDNLPGMSNYPTTTQVNTNITNQINPISNKLENLTHEDITDWSTATNSFLESLDVETAGKTVGLDYVSERYVCNVNHGHRSSDIENSDTDGFVTINTEQTITGEKTFQNDVTVSDDDGSVFAVINPGTTDMTLVGENPTLTFSSVGTTGRIESEEGALRIRTQFGGARTLVGGSLTFSDSEGTTLKQTGVAQPLKLDAGENKVVLANQPTDTDENSLAVATVGYVQKHAGGTVKSIDTNYTPDDNGNIDLKAVRTEGDQTISGAKWFKNQIVVGPENDGMRAVYGQNRVELYHPTGTSYIDFHSFGDKADYDARIADYQNRLSMTTLNKNIEIYAQNNGQVNIAAGQDKAILNVQPSATTSTTSKAIATVGWVNTYFGRVKSVNGKGPDANGNVTIETGNGTVKSVDGVSPNNQGEVSLGAVRVTEVTTAGSIGRVPSTAYVANAVHMHHWYDIEDLTDFVENVIAISPYAIKQVDGRSPDAYGDINFGLQQNAWVKTDWQGHLTTTTDQPVALPSGTTGQSATITVLTGLSWNGTQLVASRSNLTYTNGVLTGVASASNVTINTVAYS